MSVRHFLLLAAVTISISAFLPPSAGADVVAPDALEKGATVSPLPNGFSSSLADPGTILHDSAPGEAFDFDDGFLSGILRGRVIQYSDVVDPGHPYGSGLYIDYEITLTSGDVTEFTVSGYSGIAVSVKQCGIPGCGGSGANGVLTTSASRSSDGSDISFLFGGDLSGTAHSANLQLLTNATSFADPFATFETSNGDLFSVPVVTLTIPEPSTWAMMLLGFTGLGFAGYRCAGRRPSRSSVLINPPAAAQEARLRSRAT
jgi:hypothetical protein